MSSSVIGALRVNLGIDTAQFAEGLKAAQSHLGKFGAQLQNWGASLTKSITLPMAAAAGGVATAVHQMAGGMAELKKQASLSGVDVEQFQRLAFAAKSVAMDAGKLSDVFKDINDKVGEFRTTGGGEMKDFFEKIAPKVGVTADAFARLSGPEALQLYYDSLQKANLSQQEQIFYLESVADEASALIPLLRDGGKGFKELGASAAVLTEGNVAGLDGYASAMRGLSEAMKGLVVAVVSSGIVEQLTALILKVTEWTQILAQSDPVLVKWGVTFAGLAAAIGPVTMGLGLMVTAMAAVSAPVLLTIAGLTALTAAVVAFWPEIQIAAAKVAEFGQAVADGFVRLKDQAIAALVGLVEGVQTYLVDKMNALADLALEPIRRVEEGFAWLYDKVVGNSWIPDLVNEVGNWMGRLAAEMPAQAAAAVGGANDAFAGMRDVFADVASSLSGQFTSAFMSIVDGTKSAKEAFADLARSIASMFLNRMMSTLFDNLFGGLMGGLGGMGGLALGPNGPVMSAFGGMGPSMAPAMVGDGGGANVTVVNNTGQQATARETTDGRGQRKIEVVVGEMVGGEAQRPGSHMHQAMRGAFGLQPSLVKR